MTWGDEPNTVDYDDCFCETETSMALLVIVNGQSEWIPKSQIAGDSEVQAKGDRGILTITEWFVIEKGWE